MQSQVMQKKQQIWSQNSNLGPSNAKGHSQTPGDLKSLSRKWVRLS